MTDDQLVTFDVRQVSPELQTSFIEEWEKVDRTLDSLERYQGILLVPSYIGIRNAGAKFIKAIRDIKAGSKAEAEASLEMAVSELRRSRHDALRSILHYCHYRMLLIEDQYSSEIIYQFCPGYFELRDQINAVSAKLSAEFDDFTQADQYFSHLEREYLPQLLSVYGQMMKAKGFAFDGMKEKAIREEKYKKLALAGFLVGIIGLVLAVFSLTR